MTKEIFELLIIDLDGTLVDSKKDITDALNSTFEKFGYKKLDEDYVAKFVGTGITPIIKDVVAPDIYNKFTETFELTYLENITNNTRLYPGWENVLNLKNTKKVVLTNKLQKFADKIISNLNLLTSIEKVFGRDAFRECKPSPLPILEISKIYNTNLESMLIIGDTKNDILAGQAAKIKTCGVTFGYGLEDEIKSLKPDFIINKADELISTINFKTKYVYR